MPPGPLEVTFETRRYSGAARNRAGQRPQGATLPVAEMTQSGGPRSGSGAGMPPDLAAAVGLGGEGGRILASYDWSTHPLGPPSSWPCEVRAVVATSLVSRFPVVLFLGQELSLIYNEGYSTILGEKHPDAFGRAGAEVWPEIWEVVGPMIAGVMSSGVPTWSDDLLLMLATSGHPEERYFTFTYSPIISDGGEIVGVFCAVAETTERVLGERRLLTLNALGSEMMEKHGPDEVVGAVIRVCSAHQVDLPFVAVYLRDREPDGASRAARLCGATPEAARSSST